MPRLSKAPITVTLPPMTSSFALLANLLRKSFIAFCSSILPKFFKRFWNLKSSSSYMSSFFSSSQKTLKRVIISSAWSFFLHCFWNSSVMFFSIRSLLTLYLLSSSFTLMNLSTASSFLNSSLCLKLSPIAKLMFLKLSKAFRVEEKFSSGTMTAMFSGFIPLLTNSSIFS